MWLAVSAQGQQMLLHGTAKFVEYRPPRSSKKILSNTAASVARVTSADVSIFNNCLRFSFIERQLRPVWKTLFCSAGVRDVIYKVEGTFRRR
jgi:hypothetical protein